MTEGRTARKRVAVALVAATLLAPATANAAESLPFNEAAVYADDILTRKFKGAYEAGYNVSLKCNRRLGALKVGCRPSWIVGDLSYSGKLTIRVDDDFYYARYRIVKVNHYCQATGGGDCKKTYRFP